MSNIVLSINLLPKELVEKGKKSVGLNLLNKISVLVLVTMVFFASITLSLRLMQRINLQTANDNLVLAESQNSSLAEREAQLSLLKEYLSTYKSLSSTDEKKKAVFSLVAFLAPAEVQFNDITISRDGNTMINASSRSLSSIDKLLNDLTDKEKNADLISKVDVDGLSLGKDFVYRFGLKITTR
ncbi:hypothetical protein A3C32_02985 [Candidatus Daviesbacteria bacterium RIFCSPHIGHO2_02_FULL_41_14]|uniref:Fimbrial assembly protein n=1 Tax=Candidatus Daviesbacteria bacterium RIFCSPLOWO2_01_FULL_40_24 TaxID=1797787 RepID=A0A1F5MIV5_9BACT|nr:MAG: hypothetical protein A2780_03545 [Candidatus Daviesbacteria bacterium RIFCSPHIGHO2_01_FULL_41_45]OGE35543.1 MAG: hypothetical protein A3C32_02985 [Candidatus Daviesbacteria bacterium RIFCSPHIGHO2_02_FULL_41_14]OGE65292.1 MAG: hypothetical protein A3B49_00320 [Candidatus Daviesbacteria bacterium RIFCSPLOWO2_01_FULL_40_24]